MAEQTFEAQQFAEALARASSEFERYGKLTQTGHDGIRDAAMKAKFGITDFSAKTKIGATAAIELGKAMGQVSSAMYDGKKGAAAFNDAIGTVTAAAKTAAIGLALLGGPFGLLAAAALAGVAALGEYTKAANEMSDKLFKGYQGLAESGAAASDGMSGLFEDAKKLGLSMNDISQYTDLIAANSKDLALFSGTVYQGRKAFADVVEGMDEYKISLFQAGLSQQQINAGAMGYLKLQTKIGQTQNKTTQELADGAYKYLVEMDGLSKITGETRKGMEDSMEAARSEERFAARLQELRAKGEFKAARELELTSLMLSSVSKSAGRGFRDLTSGVVDTEAGLKLYQSTQGKALEQANKLGAGLTTAADATQVIATSAGNTAKNLTGLAKVGVFDQIFLGFADSLKLGLFGDNGITEQLKKSQEEFDKQGGKGKKAADDAVRAQADLIKKQQDANEANERFIKAGIVKATDAMSVLADASTAAANALNKIAGIKTETSGRTPSGSKAAPSPAATAKSNAKQTMAATTASVASNYTKNQMSPQEAKNVLEGGSARDITAFGGKESLTAIASGTATQGGGKTRAIGAASTDKPIAAVIGAGPGFTKVKAMDGENQSREGVRNWRNNNPGNLEFGPFAKSNGAVGTDGRFAVFSTLDAGMAAKEKLLFDTKSYAGLSVEQAISRYAPSFENNTAAYAKNVANAAGVTAATKLSDLNSSQRKSFLDAINRVEGFKEGKIVSAADGGMFGGPTSGYPATLHGDEAVIPLKDGAVPVSISLKDAMSQQNSAAGLHEYSGYNMGPMSTDMGAVKDIATSMGAFDRASQTITNPETWKQIINSGVAMNYDMGMAKIGTSIIPGIGIEIGNAVKELQAQKSVDTETAIKEIAKQFAEALPGIFQASLASNPNIQAYDPEAKSMASLLEELVAQNKISNDIQSKILRSAN